MPQAHIDPNAELTPDLLALLELGVLCGQRLDPETDVVLRSSLERQVLSFQQLWEAARHVGLYCGSAIGRRIQDRTRALGPLFEASNAALPIVEDPPEPRSFAEQPPSSHAMVARRAVLGDEYHNRTLQNLDSFNQTWVNYTANAIYGDTWSNGILSHAQLSILTLGVLGGAGRSEEFELHFRNALLRTGVSLRQLRDALLMIGSKCGAPTGRDLFVAARRILREEQIDVAILPK